MKKRMRLCMIFIFSSLCSCSRTLLPCCSFRTRKWQVLQRARLHWSVAQRSRATSNPKPEANLLQNSELRPIGSSRTIIEFHHNFSSTSPPQDLTISLDPANTRSHDGSHGKLLQRSCGKLQHQCSRMARGLHREPRDRRNTSSRRNFS